MASPGELDAIVVASEPLSRVRIAGLTARERAIRVARRVGADRIYVIEGDDGGALARWRGDRSAPILVIRADQLVHTGLVEPLIAALPRDGMTLATVPEAPAVEDLTVGSYAGAFVAAGSAVEPALAALREGRDVAFVTSFTDAARAPHGAIARAPIATPAERRLAHRVLYRILVKPQDNAITRYLYRPVSFPLTRLLVWTPITPNQISYAVAAMVAIGCWVTAHASMSWALAGTVIVLAASYLDCCDGEVARVKLLSSRFGAWIDTIVDEVSTVGYMIAIGWHCHLAFGPHYFGDLGVDPWKLAIAITAVTYLVSIYCIYYNIIVAVGSANSQDYVGRFEIVPGCRPNSVKLRPAAAKAIAVPRELPPVLRFVLTYAPYIVRRDFISWGAVVLVALHWSQVAFLALVGGGVGTFVITVSDHLRLRALRRSIERKGLMLEAP